MTYRNSGRILLGAVLLLAAGFALSACSTSRTTGSLVDASGKHPSSFVDAHPSYARPDGAACTECHGDDLRGGISKVSCFSASLNGVACHPAGPAFHPSDWLNKTSANFHGTAFTNNVLVRDLPCSACHDPGDPALYICLDCHFTQEGRRVPLGSTYTHGQIPGHSTFGPLDALNDNTSVCVRCHETNNLFGHMPQPFCHNCHSPAPGGGGHPAGWNDPGSHGVAAKAAPGASTGFGTCQVCHGAGQDFAGGSSGVSCTNNPDAACHGSTVASPHPSQWRSGDTYIHTNTATANASACAFCHTAGANSPIPAPPAPAPGTPPGCFNNTLCHNGGGGAPHPVPYNDPAHTTVTAATFPAAFPAGCIACHDVSAPTVKFGPVCQTCHVAASPLTALNCTSCHANPPNSGAPAGAAYPNIEGAHAEHIALTSAGTPVTCNTCHNGLGSGTLNHYNRAKARVTPGDAAFPATYNAQTGASSFDNSAALSCSNVSCHGGQATPNWRTGALNVDTQCTSCHTDGTTAQFNGPISSNHNRGPHQSAACTDCHNTTTLAVNHFTNLSTPALEGPASATIGGTGTLIPAGNYNAGSCTPACHGTKTW